MDATPKAKSYCYTKKKSGLNGTRTPALKLDNHPKQDNAFKPLDDNHNFPSLHALEAQRVCSFKLRLCMFKYEKEYCRIPLLLLPFFTKAGTC